MTEEKRELVVDPPFAVVEIGVTDPAGLHPHHGLARPGVGNHDGDERDRLALGHGDDSLDL